MSTGLARRRPRSARRPALRRRRRGAGPRRPAASRPPRRPAGLRAALGRATPGPCGVVAAYLVGFVLHAVAIWLLPLYLAQAADRDVAAGDRAGLAPAARAARAARGWSAVGRGHARAWCCSRWAPASPGRGADDHAFAVALWLGVAALALALAGRRGICRGAAARAARRARVRRLRDRRPRRRDAGRRAVVAAALAVRRYGLRGLLALLARHAPRRRAVDRRRR